MRRLALALALLALLVASPALAVTYQFATPIAGDNVPVTLALTDLAGGVEVTVSIPPGTGDLLGVFGSTTNEAGLSGMAVTSPSGVVTQWQFGPANGVWKVGGGNVMSPVKTFDWGLKLGATGSGGGGVLTATFTLTGISVAQLTGGSTQGWVFGVRIQGTSGPQGSAKIGMPVGTPPVEAPPTLEISSPADGAPLGASQVAVAGTVSGAGASRSGRSRVRRSRRGTW